MKFGQIAATSQFYLYGRRNCTHTGYIKHRAAYKNPGYLGSLGPGSLAGKVYMVRDPCAVAGRS